ncbi:hypothetical protein BN973_00501 [Mycobacterium triplex]|uniref:Uncharacterized protein n=1 Tax=Mycobacterium triplex TaxID=47839 RepID=A0A024JQQ3_9MYCO|nr:hypothetical protein BN973_00501 [Mycobacterium triplex]
MGPPSGTGRWHSVGGACNNNGEAVWETRTDVERLTDVNHGLMPLLLVTTKLSVKLAFADGPDPLKGRHWLVARS